MEEKLKKASIVIIAIAMFVSILYVGIKYKDLMSNPGENKEEPKQKEPVTPRDDLKDDLVFAFLKLENNKENEIYSPLSIRYALQILAEGAEGESREQLDAVLGEYNTNLYTPIKDHLGFGNALFIRDIYYKKVKPEYIELVKEKYGADIKEDKFENAKNANKWIEEKTLGLIKNFLKDEQVQDPDLEMMIINALAIDMDWEHKFDGENTYGSEFTKADGKKMTAETMHETFKDESLAYYQDDDVTVVRLNLEKYDDRQFEFYAIMPEEELSKYIENFDNESLDKITSDMKVASSNKGGVALAIPRFDFEYDLDFVKDLRSLGIENIFYADKANLVNIVDPEQSLLFVGDALHHAKIEFSEKGVKAAAVTVIMMKDSAYYEPEKPIIININKPFMFVIKDKTTNDIWFVGTVYEPEESK